MKIIKIFFSLVVSLSMSLSLSGIISTPILAEEENVDKITEDQNVVKTPEEEGEITDSEEPSVTDEIQGEKETEQTTTPEPNDTDELTETGVAKIGDVIYDTLDAAIKEAEEGATITLLGDARIDEGFNK